MFLTFALTVFLFTLTVAANPIVISRSPIKLPLARRFNSTNIRNLVKHDVARANAHKSHTQINKRANAGAVINEQIENGFVFYTATVGIGNPATNYTLLIDTGSSNTWVGAEQQYVRTATSIDTGTHVNVTYGSGSFSGTEFIDTVTIAPGLVIPGQSIGVASDSTGFDVDGVLGLGPVDLTIPTLPNKNSTIPTVTDNAFSKGIISANQIAISFNPINISDDVNGEITWGDIDTSKFTGSINFTPITNTFPASSYWGIDLSIRYGASTIILPTTAGIIDTGTTLILLASDAFALYRKATGGVIDDNTGFLAITQDQFENLSSLFFTIGETTYELTANAQIWPRALNVPIGGSTDKIYLIVGDGGSLAGEGLSFINGYTFLERFYCVLDTANHRVGLATTPFTNAMSN